MSSANPADPADPALTAGDADAVAFLRGFAAAHAGDETAVIQHLGRSGARVVIVAADGAFGDAVVSSVAAGREVCLRAGIAVGEWDRDLTSRITPSPEDRTRMAGTGR